MLFAKSKPVPTVAEKEAERLALRGLRSGLEATHTKAKSTADASRELAARYTTDGALLLNTSDSEIESHGAKHRAALRAEAAAKQALDEFDRLHAGEEAAIDREIRRLNLETAAKEVQQIQAEDRQDSAEQVKHIMALRELEGRKAKRRHECWMRYKDDYRDGDIHLPRHGGISETSAWPVGALRNEIETDPCSSLFSSVLVLLELEHTGLLSADDPLQAKVRRARSNGFSGSTGIKFLTV